MKGGVEGWRDGRRAVRRESKMDEGKERNEGRSGGKEGERCRRREAKKEREG